MSINMTSTDLGASATGDVSTAFSNSYLFETSGSSGDLLPGDANSMREAMTADPGKGKAADPKAGGKARAEEDAAETKSAKSNKSTKSLKSSKKADAKSDVSLPEFDPLADINIMQL